MTDAPPPPPPPPPRRSAEEEMDQLLREMTRDGVAAARRGWKLATRVGSLALKKAEEVTDQVADDLRGRRRPPTAPPPPPPASQP